MKITWVNHASFVVSTGNTSLMTDPWLEGTAFDNGWSFLSPTEFKYEEFANVTHIFISHEHPDHFSPLSLRNIPEADRKRITVLYHKTKDQRVLRYCKSLGFQTTEMPETSWFQLEPGCEVLCGRQGLLDSWLAYRCNGKVLLNLNDCVFGNRRELKHVRDFIGKPDVLFTQFSYANWAGNPEDDESRRRYASQKLEEMRLQSETLEPAVIVPCASFVWFCHRENSFNNKGGNRIEDVYQFCTEALKRQTVVLYPGDQWMIGTPHDSLSAIERYKADFNTLATRELISSEPVPFEKLKSSFLSYIRKARSKNQASLFRLVPSSTIWLTDLNTKVRISMTDGLAKLSEADSAIPDISLSSEALQYCLLYDWGGDTLAVNGRYTVPKGGYPSRFFWNFRIPAYNATGTRFDLKLCTVIGVRRLSSKLGIHVFETSGL